MNNNNQNVASIISEAAKRECQNSNEIVRNIQHSKFRNNATSKDFSQNLFTPGKVYTYIVDLYDQPISLADFKRLKPNIRATHGFYTIQYIPSGSPKRNPKFPYLIGQDLVRLRITVSGPAHWAMLCKRIPELDWLRRNSTLSGDLFRIAKMHPGLVLRFGIDFSKYCAKIENRANELGIDIDHKPLVLYQWGKNPPKVNDDGILDPKKTKSDYADVIKNVQNKIVDEEVL